LELLFHVAPHCLCLCLSLKSEIEAKQLISEQLSQAKQAQVETEQKLSKERLASLSYKEEVEQLKQKLEELESRKTINSTKGE